MRTTSILALSCLLIAAGGPATAQAPPASPAIKAPPPATSGGCAPMQPAPQAGGTASPDGATTGQSRQPLGEKLAQSDGVLCPPAGVDPDMHAQAPDTGNTPVIPPPGSPGGDPSIRPK